MRALVTGTVLALSAALSVTAAGQDADETDAIEAPATDDAEAPAAETAEPEPPGDEAAEPEEDPEPQQAAPPELPPEPEPGPEPEPQLDAPATVYAPPPPANRYPVPEDMIRQSRKPWPKPGHFAFMGAYAPSIGVGSSADFASNFGYRGFAFGVRYFINDVLSAGIESGWTYQDDKRRTTVTVPAGETGRNVTITTGNLRFTEIVPLVATAHYYYDAGNFVPHVGLALGAYYTRRDLDAGLWFVSRDGWHFGFAPEIGVMFPFGGINFFVSSRFNYLVAGSNDTAEELFFDFRIGIIGF